MRARCVSMHRLLLTGPHHHYHLHCGRWFRPTLSSSEVWKSVPSWVPVPAGDDSHWFVVLPWHQKLGSTDTQGVEVWKPWVWSCSLPPPGLINASWRWRLSSSLALLSTGKVGSWVLTTPPGPTHSAWVMLGWVGDTASFLDILTSLLEGKDKSSCCHCYVLLPSVFLLSVGCGPLGSPCDSQPPVVGLEGEFECFLPLTWTTLFSLNYPQWVDDMAVERKGNSEARWWWMQPCTTSVKSCYHSVQDERWVPCQAGWQPLVGSKHCCLLLMQRGHSGWSERYGGNQFPAGSQLEACEGNVCSLVFDWTRAGYLLPVVRSPFVLEYRLSWSSCLFLFYLLCCKLLQHSVGQAWKEHRLSSSFKVPRPRQMLCLFAVLSPMFFGSKGTA